MGAPALRSSLLDDHFAHYTAVKDFNEVMPVLLPSKFRPGPAISTDRAHDVLVPAAEHPAAGPAAAATTARLGAGCGYAYGGIEIVRQAQAQAQSQPQGPSGGKPAGGAALDEEEAKERRGLEAVAPALQHAEAGSLGQLPWRL
jgi:hypothetical protein